MKRKRESDEEKKETVKEKFNLFQIINHEIRKKKKGLPKNIMTNIANLLSHQFIVSGQGGCGEEIAIHNLKTGKCELTIPFVKPLGPDRTYTTCRSVVLSTDATLIIAGVEKDVAVYDRKTGEKLRVFTGHTETVNTVSISDDNKIIVSASRDHTARVWANEDSGIEIGVLMFDSFGEKIVISPEYVLAVGGWRIGGLVILDIRNPNKNTRIKTKAPIFDEIIFSLDGKHVMTASRYNGIAFWDVATGELTKTIDLAADAIKLNYPWYSYVDHIVFSPDKKFVGYDYSDADKRVFYMHDIENDTFKSIELPKRHWICAISITSDNKTLVCGKSHNIVLFNIETGEEIMEMYEDSRFDTKVLAISNVLME
jgi:WD40 repeat protein